MPHSAAFQRRYLGLLSFCVTVILGPLLLAACGDPATPRPGLQQETTVQRPGLRPRAASSESMPAQPPALPQAPVQTTTLTPAPAQLTADSTMPPPGSTPSPAPVRDSPPSRAPVVQVAAGENHWCALQQDGRVRCWGPNDQGQLNAPDGVRFRQITSGWRFSCGLRTDGGITCWGRNSYKQADPPAGQFTIVNAGWDHACAVSRDGATCWGRNANDRATPPSGVVFTAIGSGAEHSCGLTLGGDLVCWGRNDNGRAESRRGPFRALAVGVAHTCVLRSDGTVMCQGENAAGQSDPPETILDQITAGSDHTCGILPTGSVECWGGGVDQPSDVRFGPYGRFRSISAGWNDTCAVNEAGQAVCWSPPYRPRQPEPYGQLHLVNEFPGFRFSNPVEVFSWPLGGQAVVEKTGSISVYVGGSDPQSKLILDLTAETDSESSESGMLSAVADPEFSKFPFLYVYYTVDDNKATEQARARISRFPVSDGIAVYEEELIILDITRPKQLDSHWGGALRFGSDGMLYLGIGDGHCFECPQRLDSLHGKIIRIDVRGASAEQPYRIPEDSPLLESPDARPEIWAYGLRNPWRMAFDPQTDTLWVGDVGQNTEEEVTIATAGANLGWPIFEGNTCFKLDDGASGADRYISLVEYACNNFRNVAAPVATYGHAEGCAIVGGVVYRGTEIPWLDGVYLFGDFCSGRVWALSGDTDAGWRMSQIADLDLPLSSFGTDAAGEVYLLTFGGPILRLVEGESEYAPSVTHVPLLTTMFKPSD